MDWPAAACHTRRSAERTTASTSLAACARHARRQPVLSVAAPSRHNAGTVTPADLSSHRAGRTRDDRRGLGARRVAEVFPESLFPHPLDVGRGLVSELQSGRLVKDAIASLFRVSVGFLLAVALGVPPGLLLGHSVRCARRSCRW